MDKLPISYYFLLFFSMIFFLLFEFCVDANTPDVSTWLARSCIGEAGWNASHGDDPECAAIYHVYRKRSERTGVGIYRMIRMYSAATKHMHGRRNKWVLWINRGCDEPRFWPSNLRWSRYRSKCMESFDLADRFLSGDVVDPLPSADHYGSLLDHHRVPANWRRIKTHYRNWFYHVAKHGGKQ